MYVVTLMPKEEFRGIQRTDFIPKFALEICLGLPRRARLNPVGFNLSALRADFAIAKSGFIFNLFRRILRN